MLPIDHITDVQSNTTEKLQLHSLGIAIKNRELHGSDALKKLLGVVIEVINKSSYWNCFADYNHFVRATHVKHCATLYSTSCYVV